MLEQQLVVGRTYRFTFKPEFEKHGVCTTSGVTCLHKGGGVFKVSQIASYSDTVLNNVNLFTNFFEPLGFNETEFEAYFSGKPENMYTPEYTTKNVTTETTSTDVVYNSGTHLNEAVQRKEVGVRVENVETNATLVKKAYAASICYGSYPVYKLIDVVDPDDILWVPEQAIDGFPEVSIAEYQDVTLAVDLGYWADPNALDGMLNSMRDRLALYGIKPLAINMISSASAWLTPDEYDDIKSTRVPGTVVKIDSTNANQYLDKQAIINGEIKFIKESVTDSDTQVALSDLICYEGKIIDPNVFLRDCDPGEDLTFQQGGIYYQCGRSSVYGDFKIRLYENEDVGGGGSAIFVAGEPIPHYSQIGTGVSVGGSAAIYTLCVEGETIDCTDWRYIAEGNTDPEIFALVANTAIDKENMYCYVSVETEPGSSEYVMQYRTIQEIEDEDIFNVATTCTATDSNGKLSDSNGVSHDTFMKRKANELEMSAGAAILPGETTVLYRTPRYQYVDKGPEMTPIRFSLGDAGSYTIEGAYTVICNLLDAGTKVYRFAQSFTEAEDGHVVDNTQYTYVKSTDGFQTNAVAVTLTDGTTIASGSNIYIVKASDYEEVDQDYVDAHKTEQYYIKTKEHQWNQVADGQVGTHTFTKFQMLDYGSDTALALVGKKFKYTNDMGSITEVTMQAEDVYNLSIMETSTSYVRCQAGTKAISGVKYFTSTDGESFVAQEYSAGTTLPANAYWQHQITLANEQVMRGYLNRWFEFKDTGTGGLGLTLAMRITEDNFSKLLGKSGVVLGTKGDLWKDTYIADSSGNNNFYRLWMESINRENVLINKNNALQKLVDKLTAENKSLKS